MSNERISAAHSLENLIPETNKLTQPKQKSDGVVAQPAFVVEIGRAETEAATYTPLSARYEVTSDERIPRPEIALRDPKEATKIKEAESKVDETKSVQINLQQGVASKLKEKVQRMDGNGEAVVAGRNASAKNSVQTDQNVTGATLVVSDGHNVKANLPIDMVAMTAPKNLVNPTALPTEPIRPNLPPTVMDTLRGVATTEPDALTQPSREEAIADNQEKISEQDTNMDARWLLLQDLVQSRTGHLGWQLDKEITSAKTDNPVRPKA